MLVIKTNLTPVLKREEEGFWSKLGNSLSYSVKDLDGNVIAKNSSLNPKYGFVGNAYWTIPDDMSVNAGGMFEAIEFYKKKFVEMCGAEEPMSLDDSDKTKQRVLMLRKNILFFVHEEALKEARQLEVFSNKPWATNCYFAGLEETELFSLAGYDREEFFKMLMNMRLMKKKLLDETYYLHTYFKESYRTDELREVTKYNRTGKQTTWIRNNVLPWVDEVFYSIESMRKDIEKFFEYDLLDTKEINKLSLRYTPFVDLLQRVELVLKNPTALWTGRIRKGLETESSARYANKLAKECLWYMREIHQYINTTGNELSKYLSNTKLYTLHYTKD